MSGPDFAPVGRPRYRYTTADGGTAHFRHFGTYPAERCNGPHDVSPVHSGEVHFDARCGECYLSAAHTADYHAAALDAHVRRRRWTA